MSELRHRETKDLVYDPVLVSSGTGQQIPTLGTALVTINMKIQFILTYGWQVIETYARDLLNCFIKKRAYMVLNFVDQFF